jgi:hypothetical protein
MHGVQLTRWAEYYISVIVGDDEIRDALYDVIREKLYTEDDKPRPFDEKVMIREISGTLIPFMNKIKNVNEKIIKDAEKLARTAESTKENEDD